MAGTKKISFREFNSILKGAPRTIANETRPLEARDLVNYLKQVTRMLSGKDDLTKEVTLKKINY